MNRTDERVGLVGFGRFGRALASLAEGTGLSWSAWDPHAEIPHARRAATSESLASGSSVIALCVPVSSLEEALAPIVHVVRPDQLVIDVASVKVGPEGVLARALARRAPWCATHPLFGPVSLSRGERPLRVVVCPNTEHPRAAPRARALFERLGCTVHEMSADAHDRLMAQTHALAFFVAKAMIELDAGAGSECVPPSFRAMAQTIDTVRADAGHLFTLIQNENPHAAEARRRLIDALVRIDTDLTRAASGAAPARPLDISER